MRSKETQANVCNVTYTQCHTCSVRHTYAHTHTCTHTHTNSVTHTQCHTHSDTLRVTFLSQLLESKLSSLWDVYKFVLIITGYVCSGGLCRPKLRESDRNREMGEGERRYERVERKGKKREERAKTVLTYALYGSMLYALEEFALTCSCILSPVFTTPICMSASTFGSLASVNKVVYGELPQWTGKSFIPINVLLPHAI